jgi:ornithine cyclodeaminase/alanine dehydrogenase-like protein (mu-crystallin family)
MRVIDERELRERVNEADALAAVERAFRAIAGHEVTQPPPMAFDFEEARGEVHVKGAHLKGAPIFALKVASGFYSNLDRGLPLSSGLVMVFDAATGFPLVLLNDNAYLTELRTAGAGALAARLLAPERIRKIAVLGTGSQARYQLRAIAKVRPLADADVAAWSPRAEQRRRYADEMCGELGLSVSPADSVEEAVAGAELVLTVTPARQPFLKASAVARGATVIAVGSDGPDKQELEVALLAGADKVIADKLEQCARLGEIHHALVAGVVREDDIYGELGDVVIGKLPGREADDELIVCDLTGVGAQDAALAEIVWEKIGRER